MPSPRLLLLPAVAAAALLAGGCTRTVYHQGYIIDADLVNSVQPRVDNRQSVLQVLGRPTYASQFGGDNTWYYISRESRNYAYQIPNPVRQTTLRVRFDGNGVVQAVDRMGIDQVAYIAPSKKVTPTLGRTRGFFQDLFGGIGQVGAGGVSSQPQGGGRDTP